VAIGVGCGIGGLYLSYYVDVAAGAAIAGLLVASFVVAFAVRR
jgi:ABC-type Mn2+/Zn2+ transport system permease subunit